MGSKYTSQASSGYNASPPSDDGATTEANKVKWSTIKTKLSDVLKTFIEGVNSALVTALDKSCRTVAASDSAAASDHDRTIQVSTSSVTITLADAATMAAGYVVSVANQSSGSITVALATATDTIDTVTNTTHTLVAKETRTYIVNTAATGYLTKGRALNSLPTFTGSIGANVALNNTGNFFDGPSIAQGTSGTWFVSGTVTLQDTSGGGRFYAKLWDGTTTIAAGAAHSNGTNQLISISLSGYITSPAGNLRISCKDDASTSGLILFNFTGTSKDSTISAIRIA
jgi:hypothetical protein